MNAEPLINEAYNLANIFMLDEEARLRYINCQMSIRDYNNVRRVAYNDGMATGRIAGRTDINKLNAWLFKSNRVADAARAADDPYFQEKLMAEYKVATNHQEE